MAAVNGAGGGMPMMNNGANGATPRLGNEEEEPDYEARLNTYIYDYFVKNQRYDCAKAMLKGDMPLRTVPKRRDGDVNGAGNMHTDSKDDLESKIPDDLPLAGVPTDPQGASFLLEWFGLFWDVFFAHQRKAPPASAQAMQYVARTQHESRMRQEQQQNMLRVPGMMPAGMNGMNGMNEYHNMLFRQQNGMPVNSGDLRHKALQNQNRNFAQYGISLHLTSSPLADHFSRNPQMMAMQKQQMMQQQMRRDPSEMEMNGQRPRTPSSGDNAPSPSKRPRIEGHPGMMMQNGRPQQMLDQANNSPNALMMQGGAPNMTEAQLMAFNQQPFQVQQKSLDVFNQNLKNSQQRQNMSKPGMPGQGSPMMQPSMDMSAVNPAEFYGPPNMRMPAGMPNGNGAANGNHALQDYQMQLMLLEQQNKKRLLMARQEQEIPREGQPGMPGNFVGPPGMSPSGSRSGPSPGPNDQVKRGTPKLAQAGLPGSPMPDGSMGPNRGSPANSMSMGNGMQSDMFPMKNMNDGMAVMGPNGSMMRQAPSSHPNFNNAQFTPQQMAEMQRRGGMPNGNWQQGPQGQAPMMQQQPPPQAQQSSQMGTPQQRGNMPPPSGVPAGAAVNGRPGSPAQPAAPPTPSQGSKANPKAKKDAKDRKKPTKKNSTAGAVTAATPSSEAENPPPTPTPSTPIISVHPDSFNGQKGEAQNQTVVPQVQPPAVPAVEQPQPEGNGMDVYGMDGGDVSSVLCTRRAIRSTLEGYPSLCWTIHMEAKTNRKRQIPGAFDMTFGDFNSNQHLEQFDFDSFLQDANIMDPDQFSFENGAEAIGGS
ncbi:MAG: hypothetical protein Q9199_000293 [Rusavskia elegans]